MILYNQNYEMVGISTGMLNLFGFSRPDEFFSSCSDISEYFVKNISLYEDNKHYIELIISHPEFNLQNMILKLKNGKLLKTKISVEIVNLKDKTGHFYAVKMVLDNDIISFKEDKYMWFWEALYFSGLNKEDFKKKLTKFIKTAKELYEPLYESKLLFNCIDEQIETLSKLSSELKLMDFMQILISMQVANTQTAINSEFNRYLGFIEKLEKIVEDEMK